jgi:hypothetical protein
VKPPDDRYAKRLAELRQELGELDRQEEQLAREAAERAARDRELPLARRAGRSVPLLLLLLGTLVVVAGLGGLAVTLNRLSAPDMADAQRLGQATVRSCVARGPITTRGFGYWETCRVTITWADGEVEGSTVDEAFRSADIGTTVEVGDSDDANHYGHRDLARADAAPRPWLRWMSYGLGVIAMIPLLFLALIWGIALRYPTRKPWPIRRG